jgi:hypothetical protein
MSDDPIPVPGWKEGDPKPQPPKPEPSDEKEAKKAAHKTNSNAFTTS